MRALALLAILPACGFGFADDSSGGHDNLPASGAGPYKRLPSDLDSPADEPFVIDARDENYSDPDCAVRDGGGWRCWFTYSTDDDTRSTIGSVDVPDLHQELPVPPARVFSGGGDVSKPALAPGPNGTLLLFHQVGDDTDPSIAFATSFDGGTTFTDAAPAGINGGAPTVVLVDGTYHMYFVADGAIWHATATDASSFTVDAAPAIEPRPALDGAFDAVAVGDPFVYVTTDDAGRHHFGLFFTGVAAPSPTAPDAGAGGADTSIGYAGSFDGIHWQRFNGADPVLAAPASGPCVVPDGASTVLFFAEEQRLHLGVAAAAP
jgi:hypothetical protein